MGINVNNYLPFFGIFLLSFVDLSAIDKITIISFSFIYLNIVIKFQVYLILSNFESEWVEQLLPLQVTTCYNHKIKLTHRIILMCQS